MYLALPSQPDCASAWREAVRRVDASPGHAAYNVIIDVRDPLVGATLGDPRVVALDAVLTSCAKPIETVANTIFPQALYARHGAPAFQTIFRERLLPKIRRSDRWSGYYFDRLTQPIPGRAIDPLTDIIGRVRNPNVKALNKFEVSLFDSARDVDDSPYGGQCLSFLSFKLQPGAPRRLHLTALYRNHFYVEKLLGNLIGLGRLMAYVAREGGVEVGELTVVSTHAEIDLPGGARRTDLAAWLGAFDAAAPPARP